MSSKDKVRRAVLVSVIDGGEFIEISMDDVTKDVGTDKRWTQREHITRKKLSRASLENVKLSETELADIGHYLLSRLSAFLQRKEV